MSGKARITLDTPRTTYRMVALGAPKRVDHSASGSATAAPAVVPSTARRSVSMNALRVRGENI